MLVVSTVFWSEIKQINHVMRVPSSCHTFFCLLHMGLSDVLDECFGQVRQAGIHPAGALNEAQWIER